ncbi:hypothetical protein Misp06_01450 [Microbulbifer sp. NBRC 101763]
MADALKELTYSCRHDFGNYYNSNVFHFDLAARLSHN